jgi:hypothetical protein
MVKTYVRDAFLRFADALDSEVGEFQTWPDSTDSDRAIADAADSILRACAKAARVAAKGIQVTKKRRKS